VKECLSVGILGDFNGASPSHLATNAAVEHAAAGLGINLRISWIATPSLLDPGKDRLLEQYDALWLSPGSPYQSMEGAIAGVEFARLRDWPFFAT